MKATERYIGLILERNQVTGAEIVHSPKGFTLTAAGSFKTSLNFDDQDSFGEQGASQRERTFANELQAFLKSIGAGGKIFSFGLNSKMAMVHTLPVEMSLTDEEFDRHLEWELSQYYDKATPDTHVISAFALASADASQPTNALMISVRKYFRKFLENVCAKLHGTLHILDVDHFCAEYALIYNFPHVTSKQTVLVGMDEETCDASLLIGGKTADVFTMRWRNERDLAKVIAYAQQKNAETIFVHGRIVTPAMLEQMKSQTLVQVEMLDPFRKVALPESVRNPAEIKAKRQEYSSAIGLALRTE